MTLPHRRQFLQFIRTVAGLAALTVVVITLSTHIAWSQTTRAIKIIVPFPPGGPTDFLARLLAEQMRQAQGITIVIENRAGASAIIGTEAASRVTPDGNTLLINSKEFVINPHLRKVSYDPLLSFEPICQLVSSPTAILVNNTSPYRTLADLIDAARARPGSLTLAGSGPGSPFDIGFETLKRAASIDMAFVPYSGGAPAVNALLGGHVTSFLGTYGAASELLTAGKLRALAITSQARIPALPEVPTIAEAGYKDVDVDIWYGIVAPAKTPNETILQLAGWFAAALQVPEIGSKLQAQGLYPVGKCGADFRALIRKEYDEYGRAIRQANIKAE